MVKGSGGTGVISVCDALEVLKTSLRQQGLDNVNVTINCHGLSRERSGMVAGILVAGGFGKAVRPIQKPVKYPDRDCWFSWFGVEQGSDNINLFFDVEPGEQSINFIPNEKEAS